MKVVGTPVVLSKRKSNNYCFPKCNASLSLSGRILLCTVMVTEFIEFMTAECVSDHRETLTKSTQSSKVVVS